MSKSQAIAFFEEISKNNQLAQEVKKVVGGKNSDKAKAKELLSLAKTKGFNFTQEEAASAKGALKVSLSPKDMLEVSGGAGPKSSIMALTLLAGLGVGGAALTNMEASAMKPNHQQASPQTQTEFEMSFDEDFEEDDEMESPSELNLAPEATQEQSQSVPYVFLNYHENQLYMGDISETLDAYGATARIAALGDGINCTLKLYGPEWGLGDYPFVLNFDVSEGAVRRGTGLLIVGPGNIGLRIHFRVQESSFRNRILLWFEKVDGEVNAPYNWGILSAPQLSVRNFGDIRFTTAKDFEKELPSELNQAALEATQEQSQRIPYISLNYNDEKLYQGDISETLVAYGATARIAVLRGRINCTLKLYGSEWGLKDSSFRLNFDISESAVRGGTGLIIVSPCNTGLLIRFKVQESSFRDKILLWFEKVDGEVNAHDNWGILYIDSISYSTPQLFWVKDSENICFCELGKDSENICFHEDFCEKDKMMLKNLYATYLSTDWTDNNLYKIIYCFLGTEIRDSKNPYSPINTEYTQQICDAFRSIGHNYKTSLQDGNRCTYIRFVPEEDLSIAKSLKKYRITVNTKTELDTLKILYKLVEVFMTKQDVSNYIFYFKGLLTTLDSQPLITNSMLIKSDKIVIYFYDDKNLEVKQEILNLIKDSDAEISPSMSAFYQIGLYEDKAANDPYNHGIGFGRESDRSSFAMTRTNLIINALNDMTQLDINQQTEDAFINNVKVEFLMNGIDPQTPHLQYEINGCW